MILDNTPISDLPEIPETTKAWAAGAFDGEGSGNISINGNIAVTVSNNQKLMIDTFMLWKGRGTPLPRIRRNERQTRCYVLSAADAARNSGKNASCDHHIVTFNYPDAEILLCDMYPYLRVREPEASIIIRAISKIRNSTLPIKTILWPYYLEYMTVRIEKNPLKAEKLMARMQVASIRTPNDKNRHDDTMFAQWKKKLGKIHV